MTKSDFLRIAALVGELWPRQDWPPESVASSFETFEALTPKAVEAAVRELSATGRDFAPPPGLVLQYAKAEDSGRLALPPPDVTRDLTPEEQARARKMARDLRGQIADLAKSKIAS